jgi:deoxyribodipyrimidine photo-lyase
MKDQVSIFWFRRDLRLHDNAALYYALKAGYPVVPIFIFDTDILDKLEDKQDRRVAFIYDAIELLQQQLVSLAASLEVYHGVPQQVFESLINKYDVKQVYTNHDYEPYAIYRDNKVSDLLQQSSTSLFTYKDQVIFEKGEVVRPGGDPYTVFTPYSKTWLQKLNDFYLSSYPVEKYFSNFYKQSPVEIPSLKQIGFERDAYAFPEKQVKDEIIKTYSSTRDFPSLENGTSRMGVHLRFGTLSIRELARRAQANNQTYLNELIWREFYQMILWHFPKVAMGHAFKAAYENIEWRNNEDEFAKWCDGMTGYPIVDAGMRELNTTGFMHNRVRMITASFLTKHLLIDWRWGEAYFAQKLLDYELASNNGGWQWAAGSGCDAAPYFRIFNPYLQTQKFEKELKYIRKWVPDFEEFSYPKPIVQHEFARKRALEVYAKALKQS